MGLTRTPKRRPPRVSKARRGLLRALRVVEYREELLKEAAIVPEVDLWSLINAVLPPPPQDWEQICQAVSSQMVSHNTGRYRWKCLPTDAPDNETEVFRFVSQIFEGIKAIASADSSDVTCTVAMNTTLFSARMDSTKIRPDAYFHFLNATPQSPNKPPVDWTDIILPIEVEGNPYDDTTREDFAKIIWSMDQLMWNDPSRRFAFGLTIDGMIVRLWFNDRCGVVASCPFDINENWCALVRIIVGIIRAPPDQLGYDLDMRRVRSKGKKLKPQYDIIVRTEGGNPSATVYRTIQMLSDVGATTLLGGGTRVWKVQKLVDGIPQGPYYALKDVWVRSDCVPEHVILKKVKEDQEGHAQYFLTVLDAGFVPANPVHPHVFDDTSLTIRHGETFDTTNSPLDLLAEKPTTSTPREVARGTMRGTVGLADNIPRPNRDSNRPNYPRQHYRIVFKEVGTPVHDLRNFGEVLVALEGGSEGLHALHLSGRVHRDVSPGNVMLVRDPDGTNPRGVILDFEYVREVANPDILHNVKTGTVAFMSVEVELGMYSHFPTIFYPDVPFRHNALHDLESIWWTFMFMIFYLVHPDETRTPRQHSHYSALFKTVSSSQRLAFWTTPHMFHYFTNHLIATSELVGIMYDWMARLKATYAKSYTNYDFYNISAEVLEEAREERKKIFDRIRKAVRCYPGPCDALLDLPPVSKTPVPQQLMYVSIPVKNRGQQGADPKTKGSDTSKMPEFGGTSTTDQPNDI